MKNFAVTYLTRKGWEQEILIRTTTTRQAIVETHDLCKDCARVIKAHPIY